MPTSASFDTTSQQAQFQPQFDWGHLIGPIVTSVLSALSSSPQLSQSMRPQSAGPDQLQPLFRPQSAGQDQLQPQFDWGSLVGTIVPIVLSVLSTSPQLSQMMRPQQTAASVLH